MGWIMRRLFLALLLALVLPANLWAASITSNAVTGDVDSPSTWVGGVVPGAGDTVILADGAIISIPHGVVFTIGTSPSDDISTPAISCASSSGTGRLIINGTLVFRGSVKQCNANWTATAGATIHHDSSLSVSPAATNYTWQIGMVANQANAILQLSGTGQGSSRVTVDNAPGSGRFGGWHGGQTVRNGGSYPTGGVAGSGRISATYTTFNNVGALAEMLTTRLDSAGQELSFDHCIFNNSRRINVIPNFHTSAILRIKNTSFLSPNESVSARLWFNTSLGAGGVREITDNIVEGQVEAVYGRDLTIDRNAFAGTATAAPLSAASTYIKVASFADNMHFIRYGASTMPVGQITKLTSLYTYSTGDDDHFRHSGQNGPLSIDGAVLEYSGNNTNSDALVFEGAPTVETPITLKNVLQLPSGNDTASANLFITVGSGGSPMPWYRLTIENNTMIGPGGGLFLTESTTLGEGVVQSIRNNLRYSVSANSTSYMQTQSVTQPVNAAITIADYNASYNGPADLYQSPDVVFSTTPGVHDIVDVNPRFVDTSRDFLSWGKTINPAHTTWADIWAEIRKRNDDNGYNPAYDWREFYKWARAGFAPTNQAYKTAGYGGTYIGAIDVATLGNPAALMMVQ